jgi:RimJ/RimL family protein N-acetyltransferase
VALLPDRLDAGDIELLRLVPELVEGLVESAHASYAELHQWMTWAEDVPTREEVADFARVAHASFESNTDWAFVMVESSTGDVVGSCDLRVVGDTSCLEIGYWVRTDRTGRGYATSAAEALTDAAFHYLDFERVTIRMDQANTASARVPPKIGYRLLYEENRKIETPGHSGRGFIWARDRES